MRAGALHHACAARADTSQHAARSETVTLPTTRPSSTTTPQAAPSLRPDERVLDPCARGQEDELPRHRVPNAAQPPVSAGWRSDFISFIAHSTKNLRPPPSLRQGPWTLLPGSVRPGIRS